jgi:hypothetical protein
MLKLPPSLWCGEEIFQFLLLGTPYTLYSVGTVIKARPGLITGDTSRLQWSSLTVGWCVEADIDVQEAGAQKWVVPHLVGT